MFHKKTIFLYHLKKHIFETVAVHAIRLLLLFSFAITFLVIAEAKIITISLSEILEKINFKFYYCYELVSQLKYAWNEQFFTCVLQCSLQTSGQKM